MSKKTGQRLWKAVFATLVASVFAAYCVFWNKTFDAWPEATGAEAAAKTQDGCSCGPAAVPVAEALPQGEDTALDDVGDEAEGPESTMFRSRIYGPYALSVRDGLNEMLIGTHLMAQGIQAAADPSASLASVMSALPSQLPSHGYISSGFGDRRSPFTGRRVHHNGIDFAVSYGSPVYATADGVVTYAKWWHQLGKTVAVDHGFGIVTRYGHNSAVKVKVGDRVHRGDLIALAGSTGRSTGSHVHYEVWVNDHAIDPSQFMFEVPAESLQPLHQVALDPYAGRRAEARLGLGMGGDGDLAQLSRARQALPTTADRLPENLAITGAFLVVAIMLVGSLIPRSGRDDEGELA